MLKVICLVVAFIFNSINITYACHYENIKVGTNGEIKGHLVPCNDENCPTFQQLLKQKGAKTKWKKLQQMNLQNL